eukprot:gnl/Trimastix_PCT/992.p3 GENE.gnl/Trimastix_PCT/992~~gnl/Trimastix_PCT/992.p3  ORF type:complete len:137 (+),score=59.38 gnl/Trimastix_PCT/992:466-876(+)
MWSKKGEFQAWLADIKQIDIESITMGEQRKLFTDFMEDYNTATFPSKKYYNLDVWTVKQLRKGARKQQKEGARPEGHVSIVDDEASLRSMHLNRFQKQRMQEQQDMHHESQSRLYAARARESSAMERIMSSLMDRK